MSQEKQSWYVHSSRGQEGPFTLDDLKGKISRREVSAEDFGWCVGMADWKKLREIGDLKAAVAPGQNQSSAGAPQASPLSEEGLSAVLDMKGMVNADDTSNLDMSKFRKAQREAAAAEKSEKKAAFEPLTSVELDPASAQSISRPIPAPATPRVAQRSGGAVKWALVSVAALVVVGLVFHFAPKLRELSESWVSGAPDIPGLSAGDQDLVKSTVFAPVAGAGPKLAVVASGNQVYLVTNLPDGARFDLVLRAIPSTLASEPKDPPNVPVTIGKHFAQSPVLDVPAGSYWVAVSPGPENDEPDAVKAFVERIPRVTDPFDGRPSEGGRWVHVAKVVLGSPPDAAFGAKLKDFQQARRERAKKELETLQGLAGKIESFIGYDAEMRRGLLDSRNRKNIDQAWDAYHQDWDKNFGDIEKDFDQKPVFFSNEFGMAAAIKDQLRQLHERAHVMAGASAADLNAAKAEVEAISEKTKAQLQDLRHRIEGVAKRLSDSTGYFEGEGQK